MITGRTGWSTIRGTRRIMGGLTWMIGVLRIIHGVFLYRCQFEFDSERISVETMHDQRSLLTIPNWFAGT